MSGSLVVVATPIGNLGDLSPRALETLRDADVLACEDTRRTGRLLTLVGVSAPRLVSLHAHNEAARAPGLVEEMLGGATVALVSDAGTPVVSDPGGRLVAAAIGAGIEVFAVPGPSAALAALAVSGMAAPRWTFEGFLARKGGERRERLASIAAARCPSILFEAPARLRATLADLAAACGAGRRVVVARELTKLHEEVRRGTLAEVMEQLGTVEPLGEHVIVVDAAPQRPAASREELVEAIGRLRDAGLARREAVSAVQVLLGAMRGEAYDAALAAFDRAGAGPPPSRRSREAR